MVRHYPDRLRQRRSQVSGITASTRTDDFSLNSAPSVKSKGQQGMVELTKTFSLLIRPWPDRQHLWDFNVLWRPRPYAIDSAEITWDLILRGDLRVLAPLS